MLIQQLFKITDNLSGDSKASNPCIRRLLFSPNKKQQNVSGYVIIVLMEKERINARNRTINLSITSKF